MIETEKVTDERSEFILKPLNAHNQETVILEVGGKQFECSRALLVEQSEFFDVLLNSQAYREAREAVKRIPEIELCTFKKIYEGFEKGSLDINEEFLIRFLHACDFLQLTVFKNKCEEYILQNLRRFTKLNLIQLFSVPYLSQYNEAFSAVFNIICSDFFHFSMAHRYELDLDHLKEIVTSPLFLVKDVNELYNFCIQWLCHKPKERVEHIFELNDFIFPNIEPYSLPTKNMIIRLQEGTDLHYRENMELISAGLWKQADQQPSKRVKGVDFGHNLICFSSGSIMKPSRDLSLVVYYGDSVMDSELSTTLPGTCKSLQDCEGTVLDKNAYICSYGGGITNWFYVYDGSHKQWIQLKSPRTHVQDLVSCTSKLFSYQAPDEKYQFHTYEPKLDRWLTVPSMNHPRHSAGVAGTQGCVYAVGGLPIHRNQAGAESVAEFYDHRCSKWYNIRPRFKTRFTDDSSEFRSLNYNNPKGLRNLPCSKLAVFLKTELHVLHNDLHFVLDIRSHRWTIYQSDRVSFGIKYLTTWNNHLCYISGDGFIYRDEDKNDYQVPGPGSVVYSTKVEGELLIKPFQMCLE